MTVQIQWADKAIEFDRFGIPRAREGYWVKPPLSRDPFALVRKSLLTDNIASATMIRRPSND